MSGGDEDTELRDLVTQTLENNGLLGKIQAQLRAGVFLALEETDKTNRKVHHNKRLQQFLSTKDGLLAAGMVQEFLEFFQLDYTGAVFEPESGMVRLLRTYGKKTCDIFGSLSEKEKAYCLILYRVSGKYEGRSALEGQIDCDVSDELPLIAVFIKQSSTGGHNVHLNNKRDMANTTRDVSHVSRDSHEDTVNDSLDFFSNRKPIDDMVNKYANNSPQGRSPHRQLDETSEESSRTSDKELSRGVTSRSKIASPDKLTSRSERANSPVSDQISEQISEHITTENSSQLDVTKENEELQSTKEWDEEYKKLDDKLENIGIKTPTDLGDKSYGDDFEKSTEEVSAISDISDILHTSEKATDKGVEESVFTSDHTISLDSVGDIDYVEDMTF